MDTLIELKGLTHRLASGERMLTILDSLDLRIPARQFACVTGPSGSGKSTLLGLVAGIDRAASGTVVVAGHDYGTMSEDELAAFRGSSIGVVFQSFHLIPTLTAVENVQVPMELLGRDGVRARALELLDRVGLAERAHHYPVQLSGGEQQRVALARAFANEPVLLLADEPTGNLDSANGAHVMELMERMHQDLGTTLLLVTHEAGLAARAQRVLTLVDGRLTGDTRPDAGAAP
jgi:putative ABC transport system ATP-binding protein